MHTTSKILLKNKRQFYKTSKNKIKDIITIINALKIQPNLDDVHF